MLSEDKFKEGTFYLDTNILIAYIFEEHPHHTSARYLIDIIQKKLRGKIKVAQITLDEFDSWFEHRIPMLTKTFQAIPGHTTPKVRGIILSEYRKYIKTVPFPNKKNIEGFVDIVDDAWFGDAVNNEDVKKIADELRTRYFSLRNGDKPLRAALHDARILKWIDIERRKFSTPKIWLITLDTTLPSALYKNNTLSITLDAFLQWVSPFIEIPSVEGLFSRLIQNRFFPPEKIFDLKDFLIFYELDIHAKDLPPEDVEEAITYLKSKFGEITLDNPDSFSEISYELARFFADPSRKYQQEIRRAYDNQENLKKEYERKLGELQKQIKEVRSQYQDRLNRKDNELEEIKKRLEQIELEKEQEKLRSSAVGRLLVTISLVILIEIFLVYAIWRYGTGENFFQKLTNSWIWLSTGIPVFIVLGWFIIGKERLMALGWPVNKIFKISEKGDTKQ